MTECTVIGAIWGQQLSISCNSELHSFRLASLLNNTLHIRGIIHVMNEWMNALYRFTVALLLLHSASVVWEDVVVRFDNGVVCYLKFLSCCCSSHLDYCNSYFIVWPTSSFGDYSQSRMLSPDWSRECGDLSSSRLCSETSTDCQYNDALTLS